MENKRMFIESALKEVLLAANFDILDVEFEKENDTERVLVHWIGGAVQKVAVKQDSNIGILSDVVKAIM
ncbi:hypothetical protein [Eubacterium sp.]|uniref:hypothetical protein n=1 Tax=Eubacterium sp. TaxID=142586 RepID=UPI002FC8194C